MKNEKNRNSIDTFIHSRNYQSTSEFGNPEEQCRSCTAFFGFKGKTRCYIYELEEKKDKDIEFNPNFDGHCEQFEDSVSFDQDIRSFCINQVRELDPDNAAEYELEYEAIQSRFLDNFWHDVGYPDLEVPDESGMNAHCLEWIDEPENCYRCADDECPMNKG